MFQYMKQAIAYEKHHTASITHFKKTVTFRKNFEKSIGLES